jgi:predicted DNA-binding transcriptional regulator YafY
MAEAKKERINKIIGVLAAQPDGMWLRSLAQKTKIPPATIHRYIENDLKDIVDNLGVKSAEGRYFGLRIIRLKPKIIEVLEEGGFDKLQKFLEMSKSL